MTKRYRNKKCADCKNLCRRVWQRKGKLCCYKCSRKYLHNIGTTKHYISLEEALNRVYTIKCYSPHNIVARFPSILAGYKFKVQLVEGK